MKTLIKNGLLIDPANQIQAYLNLVLEDGRVAAVTEECPEADSVIDAARKGGCSWIHRYSHARGSGEGWAY